MTSRNQAPTTPSRTSSLLVASLFIVIGAIFGYRLLALSSTDVSPIEAPRSEQRGAASAVGPDAPRTGDPNPGTVPALDPDRSRQQAGRPPGLAAPEGVAPPPRALRGGLGESDGIVP